jgi:Uma2 family endonuclease
MIRGRGLLLTEIPMTTQTDNRYRPANLQQLQELLGDVPLDRIQMQPPPGTATEDDVLTAEAEPRKRICELFDGVLVEKATDLGESLIAGVLIQVLWNYLEEHDLGVVLGEGGMLRLFPGRVRIPDVSFISWNQLPGGTFPETPIAEVAPDLAIEVLSAGNTKREIQQKLHDLFLAGTKLVWVIQPRTETAEVYTSPDDKRRVGKNQALDGNAVLPGLRIPLMELFAKAKRRSRRR